MLRVCGGFGGLLLLLDLLGGGPRGAGRGGLLLDVRSRDAVGC